MDTLQNDKYYGKLIIQASAASGAIPIQGATVVVRTSENDGPPRTLGVFKTDINGLTEPLPIETPPLSESLAPGGKTPFSRVMTEVSADGYYSTSNINIPIYPGITSIQPVSMIPLPDTQSSMPFSDSDIIINNGEEEPNL